MTYQFYDHKGQINVLMNEDYLNITQYGLPLTSINLHRDPVEALIIWIKNARLNRAEYLFMKLVLAIFLHYYKIVCLV